MRAREFIVEQSELPPEQRDPLQNTYVIPGLSAADPYRNYRFGVAIARARSDATDLENDNKFKPEWTTETPFGENGVVVGFSSNIDPIIDQALKMTDTPGGKKLVSTAKSDEPAFVDTTSPIKPFRGYKR